MHIRTLAATLGCLLLLAGAVQQAQAQPQDCKDAMQARSPQAQVDLFTRCLNSGQVSGDSKATTLKQRAVAYMHLGRHQRAVDDIDQALRLKPDDADNYYLRGVSYRALGKLEQAIADSSRAIGLDSNFAAAYANRAYAYKELGNTNQARNDAQRAQALDPSVRVPSF